MRRTLRQLAAVKPTRYHEPGTPTGLTGLYTASTPRSTLLYLYSSTLDKLKTIPEHSVYRQSVEALTKHRMQAVESVKPAGYDAWAAKAQKLIQEHPEEFNVVSADRIDGANAWRLEKDGKVYLVRQQPPEVDQRDQEWDGELNEGPELEGIRTQEEREDQVLSAERKPLDDTKQVAWEDEPQLTADQYVARSLKMR